MAWERRARGSWYYTLSSREGDRVRRRYIGTGLVAALAADLDAYERAQRKVECEAWQRQREQLDALDHQVTTYCEATEALTKVALYALGFHRHRRTWRKGRGFFNRRTATHRTR